MKPLRLEVRFWNSNEGLIDMDKRTFDWPYAFLPSKGQGFQIDQIIEQVHPEYYGSLSNEQRDVLEGYWTVYEEADWLGIDLVAITIECEK
jgi:hypothetical protein